MSDYSYVYDRSSGLCLIRKTIHVTKNKTTEVGLFWAASLKDAEDAIEYMESIEC